jgi:hypothetical protein
VIKALLRIQLFFIVIFGFFFYFEAGNAVMPVFSLEARTRHSAPDSREKTSNVTSPHLKLF